MDWFEKITGFCETSYEETRSRLYVKDNKLHSRINGASFTIGNLDLSSLEDLRKKARSLNNITGQLKVSLQIGDVRQIHQCSKNAGALFQVASQFNLLEMASPSATPEDGVTRYQYDPTQGPACAISAGAATIFRNYFIPLNDRFGQTAKDQINCLDQIGLALSRGINLPENELWIMQNGYALPSQISLEEISLFLARLTDDEIDLLRGKLVVGIHQDVEVTDIPNPDRHLVSQVFCSALSVAYSDISADYWEPFAKLVLEAAYESTMWAAALNASRGVSNVVFLTLLGGGAFGNHSQWIYGALTRALEMMRPLALDARIISLGHPSDELLTIVETYK